MSGKPMSGAITMDQCPSQSCLTRRVHPVAPSWSPPWLQILESEHADRLMQWVSNLLARDDLHIVAVSPATVSALYESDSTNNPLLTPHYTITVIYQDRMPPAACEQVDSSAAAA
jgi:hypothetical protein